MNAIPASNLFSTVNRVIGDRAGRTGPTLVFFGGIHGNEPAGVLALQRVFEQLDSENIELKGRVLGLAGNLPALRSNQRYISKDLNRIWNKQFTERFRNEILETENSEPEISSISEYKDQIELFKIIQPLLTNDSQTYFFDLHTTSSNSVPFFGINDQLNNRNFAFRFSVPTVLGIEEYLEGPLLSYLNDFGNVAMAFEAGQHEDPESVEIHTSFIYLAMLEAGVVTERDIRDVALYRKRLDTAEPSERVFEVIFRKKISPEDQFRMKPGYRNFMNVAKGDVLAEDKDGPVKSTFSGKIFMPLYQVTGDDGFFIVRRVPKWALKLSSVLRKINFERFLTWLPGVSRDESQDDALVVNRRVARYLATELFHLLGYRRKQAVGNQIIFSRREISPKP